MTTARLEFYRYLGIESSTYDKARVEVSGNDGNTWTLVWEHSGSSFADSDWSKQSFDISSVAAQRPKVRIRWGMGSTDGSVAYAGWYIDDVTVCGEPIAATVTPTPSPTTPAVTPSPTPSPTSTADTPTPTPTEAQPQIMLGGYWLTDLRANVESKMNLLVIVNDMGGTIDSVDAYYADQPLGLTLLDDGMSGDLGPADTVYGIELPLLVQSPLMLPIEIIATTSGGVNSLVWPYLDVP
jgi:hypothetical protein